MRHPKHPDMVQTGHPEHDSWKIQGTDYLIADNGNGGPQGYDLIHLPTGHTIAQAGTAQECRAHLDSMTA